jgi:hypothetical protein
MKISLLTNNILVFFLTILQWCLFVLQNMIIFFYKIHLYHMSLNESSYLLKSFLLFLIYWLMYQMRIQWYANRRKGKRKHNCGRNTYANRMRIRFIDDRLSEIVVKYNFFTPRIYCIRFPTFYISFFFEIFVAVKMLNNKFVTEEIKIHGDSKIHKGKLKLELLSVRNQLEIHWNGIQTPSSSLISPAFSLMSCLIRVRI